MVQAVKAPSPHSRVAMYDMRAAFGAGYKMFAYDMAFDAGVMINPAVYNVQKNLSLVVALLNAERRDAPSGAPVLPWWEPDMAEPPGYHFALVVTMMTSGASGHLVFQWGHVTDAAVGLEIAEASAIAARHEDVILRGSLVAQSRLRAEVVSSSRDTLASVPPPATHTLASVPPPATDTLASAPPPATMTVTAVELQSSGMLVTVAVPWNSRASGQQVIVEIDGGHPDWQLIDLRGGTGYESAVGVTLAADGTYTGRFEATLCTLTPGGTVFFFGSVSSP